VIARGLQVLFCGINPGLYTAAVGHHFARPGNRFWPALHQSGFTDRLLSPFEEDKLLDLGYGITNLVARATASAAELESAEYVRGARILEKKVRRYRPKCVAFVGIGAYRLAFDRPSALIGRQPERLDSAMIWALPSTSGLNANYRPNDLVRLFAELRGAVHEG
jgi:double-stranded uracil-DNA glycosylase